MKLSKVKLVIFSPRIGVRSETFIMRHIEMLCPGQTVVITNKVVNEEEGDRSIDCPVYKVNSPNSLLARGGRYLGRCLNMDCAEYVDSVGLKKILKGCSANVIMGQYLDKSWPFIRLANELGVKFFAHAHGYDLSRVYKKRVWRRRYADYKNASGVIVVNNVMKERMLSVGVPPEKIHIIPYGVDVPGEPLDRKRGKSIRCLAVGRMVAKKAPVLLLEAFRFAINKYPDIRLDYVGDGELFSDVQRFIDCNKLHGKVRLHGAKDHGYVLDMMKRSDIFLQHSIVDPKTGDEEGVPVSILEAMAMSLPVVSTRHAGIPEAVVENETGFLVDEGDVAEMSKKILKLAESPMLRRQLGAAGWSRVSENFTWNNEKDKLLDILL